MSSAGWGLSWQKMVSVGTSIVPPGPRPPPADTPGPSTAVTTPQVTASIHDFAASLANGRPARPCFWHAQGGVGSEIRDMLLDTLMVSAEC